MLVDSHAHLADPDFNPDREAVIERARAAGVQYLLAIGGGDGPDDLGIAVPLTQRHDWIYATVGIHPHVVSRAEERHFDQLRAAATQPRVLAVGEIGLDYHYDHSPRHVQRRLLMRQLEAAREAKLPVVIHCRDAWPDLRDIVRHHWQSAGLGGILHCFTGSSVDARTFLDWGFMISFAGNLTFKKAEPLRTVAREVPMGCLLTETDSPYLAPVPHRGNRNEPAYVVEVTRALAALRSRTEEEMGRQVVENFARFFRLS